MSGTTPTLKKTKTNETEKLFTEVEEMEFMSAYLAGNLSKAANIVFSLVQGMVASHYRNAGETINGGHYYELDDYLNDNYTNIITYLKGPEIKKPKKDIHGKPLRDGYTNEVLYESEGFKYVLDPTSAPFYEAEHPLAFIINYWRKYALTFDSHDDILPHLFTDTRYSGSVCLNVYKKNGADFSFCSFEKILDGNMGDDKEVDDFTPEVTSVHKEDADEKVLEVEPLEVDDSELTPSLARNLLYGIIGDIADTIDIKGLELPKEEAIFVRNCEK